MVRRRLLWMWVPAVLAVVGCDGDGGEDEEKVEGCDRVFAADKSDRDAIQTALIEAGDDTTLCFRGTFEITTDRLSASDKKGLTLKGIDEGDEVGAGAVFDFKDTVGPTGLKLANMEGITIENITVKNTLGDGVEVRASTDLVIRKTKVTWDRGPDEVNGAYGFYPVESVNVLMEDNEASNSADAGIYVGQSENIIIRRNKLFGNVSGIQVENSKLSEVYENEAYDNTAGIFVHDLPGLPAGNGGNHLLHDNLVYENNRDNFAPEGIAQVLPKGIGMMVLTVDNVEVRNNEARDNDSAGLLLVSFETVKLLETDPRDPDPNYDPYPEGVFFHDNTFSNNGTMPADVFFALLPSGQTTTADIVWDGQVNPDVPEPPAEARFCVQASDGATFFNLDVANNLADGADPTDMSGLDCRHDPLAAVDNGLG